MKRLLFILSLFLVTIGFASCDMEPDSPKRPLPSFAIPDSLRDHHEQIIEHFAYTVSYNPDWLIPNWVAYRLTKEDTDGKLQRANDYYPDPDVNGYQVVSDDYKYSGYNRGHMAAADDMKWSWTARHECCFMTNICPQTTSLNSGRWETLEGKVQKWAQEYDSIFIVCGPIVSKRHKTIGKEDHPIAVPNSFFKVLLVHTQSQWQGIGFIMYNDSENVPYDEYTMSIDDVEALTGIDFFYKLDKSTQDIVERECDLDFWFSRDSNNPAI